MAPLIFLSHAHHDAGLALDLARALESRGARCWLSERDVPPGADYAACVVRAVEECRTLVVLVTPEADASVHVRREMDLALAARRPIIPILVGCVECSEPMRYRLSTAQWMRLDCEPKTAEIARCAEAVVGAAGAEAAVAKGAGAPPHGSAPRPRWLAIGAAIAGIAGATALVMRLFTPGPTLQPPSLQATPRLTPSATSPVRLELPRQIRVVVDPGSGWVVRASGPVLSEAERGRAAERIKASASGALIEIDVNPEAVAAAARKALEDAGIAAEVALRRRPNWGEPYLFVTIRSGGAAANEKARTIAEKHTMSPESVAVHGP